MKVAIVTLHKVLNFGSVLQAYCTCKAVKSLGFEPQIVDYMEPRYTTRGSVNGIFREVSRGNGDYLKKLAIAILKSVSFFLQRRNFEKFISNHLPLTRSQFTDFSAISKNPPEADIYLTGSDQVWNSEYNGGVDRAHFLDFAPSGKLRVSYAASFGKDNLRAEETAETKTLLRRYSAISVRESSAVQIIESIGIHGAQQVLDPTLLLDRNDWHKEFNLSRPIEQKYLLIYSVERSHDDIVYATARKIADREGLAIVFLSQAAKLKSMSGCEFQRPFSKVNDFLSYFYHADFVVVSSFHGTAFAINFNRQFVSVLPPRFGARPRSLLNLVGLNDRIVEKDVDLSRTLSPIDYSPVNRILKEERLKSFGFLKTALDGGVLTH